MDDKHLLALIVDLQERVRRLEAAPPRPYVGTPIKDQLLRQNELKNPFDIRGIGPATGIGQCVGTTGLVSFTN